MGKNSTPPLKLHHSLHFYFTNEIVLFFFTALRYRLKIYYLLCAQMYARPHVYVLTNNISYTAFYLLFTGMEMEMNLLTAYKYAN